MTPEARFRPLSIATLAGILALVTVSSFWLTSASAQTRVGTPAVNRPTVSVRPSALFVRFSPAAPTAGTSGTWGLTRATAADQLRLLKLVFVPNGVLSEASRAYVSSLMSAVAEGQDWGVTAAADDEDDSAVKNGWLPRSTTGLWDVISIGRVVAGKHHLLVVVVVTSANAESAGIATIEKAASAAVKKVLGASGRLR